MASGSKKVVYAALVANGAIAASKLGVGLVTGSVAMLAEAAHSIADAVNQGFLLLSIRLSDEPPDQEHPFGHGKERFFWAFLAAIFIFVAGAFFSIYEGIKRMLESGQHEGAYWPSYLVLGVAFAFDGIVLVMSLREARRQGKELGGGILKFIRESPDVTLKTALFEDAAATIGLIIAAAGLGLMQLTGNPLFDGISSVLIGLVLVAVALMLGKETRDFLLGAAAPPQTRQTIRKTILEFPEVQNILRMLTMQLGLDRILVTAEVQLDDDLDTDDIEQVLQRITDRLHETVPAARNIYLEPSASSHPTCASSQQESDARSS